MEAREIGVLAGGLIVAGALFFFDPYLAGIALVLDAALGMSFFIMGETHDIPDLACSLSEDARSVLIVNRGNDAALRIHLTLVPLDREFDLPELSADGTHAFPLQSMVAEAKVLVNYENRNGKRFSRACSLSVTAKGDEDLLKPIFPTFGWK